MTVYGRPYRIISGDARTPPLGRFLPPLAPGVTRAWLAENCAPGQWVLDPLGSNPALALEAARAGQRVLVCSNNPILSFALETLAAAPRPVDFQAALAELAAARRGGERLEQHLPALYQSQCPSCGAALQPLAFIWRREENHPHARLLHCPVCGAEGEFPTTPADSERLSLAGSDGLHRARALERVAHSADDYRPEVEEALRSYLPRPLYFLFTLLNRVDGLSGPPERKRLLLALLLSLFDEASSLWPWPAARARPRQLTVPPQFRENNLWLALETAAQVWSAEPAPLPFTRWPELPPETGGVCLYPGRLKSLLPLPDNIRPQAALALLPRPNQAFWTLSGVWTGWLWGREAVRPVRGFFERRRYDWTWHAGALQRVFAALDQQSPSGFKILGLIPDLAPGFLAAALTGAQAAGLVLHGLAQRSDAVQAQVEWRTGSASPSRPLADLYRLCRSGIRQHLLERGEPAGYALLFTAALVHTVHAGGLPDPREQTPPDFLTKFQTAVAQVLREPGFLRRFEGPGQSVESGLWWPVEPGQAAAPLSDRVEAHLLSLLAGGVDRSAAEIEQDVCNAFPGLLTPSPTLIKALLDAFSEPSPDQPGCLRLRQIELPAARAKEYERLLSALRDLAARLGLAGSGQDPLFWLTASGQPIYALLAPSPGQISAALLRDLPLPPAQCLLVTPERYAALLPLRRQTDPRLSEALANGWRLLKSEAVLRFTAQDRVTLDDWEALLNSDLPHWGEARQMPMF